MALDDQVAPWAYEKDRQPFRVVASLEALAALVALLTLGPRDGAPRARGSVLLPLLTGNRGNSRAFSRLMTTNYPLCLLVMELAATLESKQLLLEAAWAPREWNAEADALTNEDFQGFRPENRVPFDFASHRWLVFDTLREAGRMFYQEVRDVRAKRPATGPVSRRRRRGGKKKTLKEKDPW